MEIVMENKKYDYIMIALPDTQNIVERDAKLYFDIIDEIISFNNKIEIKAVLHMGDIVNRNTNEQWDIAVKGFEKLYNINIPFMPMLGNHDDVYEYNRRVSISNYSKNKYFYKSFNKDNLECYSTYIKICDREYIILVLGWAPSIERIKWAQNIIEENQEKNIIIVTHAYMFRDNRLLIETDNYSITSYQGLEENLEGYKIWEELKKYKNVVLGMSGHISSKEISIYSEKNINGDIVSSLLFDNQDLDKVNSPGAIGILCFNNNNNIVDIFWYSVKNKKLYGEKGKLTINVPHVK